MKTPPDRSGIIFEVGAQLEARDRHKNWSVPHTHTHTHTPTHTHTHTHTHTLTMMMLNHLFCCYLILTCIIYNFKEFTLNLIVFPSGTHPRSRRSTMTRSGFWSTTASGAAGMTSGFTGARRTCGRWSESAWGGRAWTHRVPNRYDTQTACVCVLDLNASRLNLNRVHFYLSLIITVEVWKRFHWHTHTRSC